MIKLAWVTAPQPSLAVTLMKQCGVEHAVYYPDLQPIPNASEEEQQWENLQYFLERVVPVAEAAQVKMAMHPDDAESGRHEQGPERY